LTHRVVPEKGGKGVQQAAITYSVLEEYDSTDTLLAVLLDNTVVNTGYKGGLVACLERKLNRKLHMIGCFLHMNELPLRHLIIELDGPTVTGNRLSGPIGSLLHGDQTYRLEPVNFARVPIAAPRPEIKEIEMLSDDQRLLMEYMFGISEGKISEKFVHRKPGPLNLARWLTTAIRILVLYTRTEDPSETLIILVHYIVKVYAFTWFTVREANSFTAGPEILFEMIQAVKPIQKTWEQIRGPDTSSITDIVFKVLERNAFCCLGENFLGSLIASSEKEHRRIGVRKVLELRAGPTLPLTPASVPSINFEARNWCELIDVSSLQCHQPPCVSMISDAELEDMIEEELEPPSFPLHSQSVERAVKLTSEASTTSYIWEKRHNSIVAKNKSRAERPEFRTKQDYV
jgi:hypothetical protein